MGKLVGALVILFSGGVALAQLQERNQTIVPLYQMSFEVVGKSQAVYACDEYKNPVPKGVPKIPRCILKLKSADKKEESVLVEDKFCQLPNGTKVESEVVSTNCRGYQFDCYKSSDENLQNRPLVELACLGGVGQAAHKFKVLKDKKKR